MMNVGNRKKEVPAGPAGTWSSPDLIGSKAMVLWIPAGYGLGRGHQHKTGVEYEITGVYHRTDNEGRLRTVYTLSGSDRLFREDEIRVTKICPGGIDYTKKGLCGEITTGL